jgi:hypothetical protein
VSSLLHLYHESTRSHRHSSAQNPCRWDTEGRCEWWTALNGVEAPACVPTTASAEAVSIRGGGGAHAKGRGEDLGAEVEKRRWGVRWHITFKSHRRCRLPLSSARRQRPPPPLSCSLWTSFFVFYSDWELLVQAISGVEGSAAFLGRGIERPQNGSPVSITGWRAVFHV